MTKDPILEQNETATAPILQLKHITKVFPGVKALTDVTLDFYPGEVHALVGENGAGKSTLVKIISGVYIANEGEMFFEGRQKNYRQPKDALQDGISIIHQELSIAKDLTVAQNIFLGAEPKKGPWVDYKKMNQDAQAVLDEMGVELKATANAGDLSAAQQQMIEIAKVITKNSKLAIMDEPTSSLSESEIEAFFVQIKRLREKGVSIIYISHRLKELPVICNKVSVLRDGCLVKTMRIEETNEAEIVSNMVGREIKDYYNKEEHQRGEEALRVENLTKEGVFYDISFSAYKGEILGIAGLVGAKRTDVLESIFAAIPHDSGKIFLNGKETHFKSPKDAIAAQIGLVTEDRRRTGLMLPFKIRDNMVLPSLRRTCKKFGFLNPKWEKEVSEDFMGKLKVKAPSILTEVETLSGGNQQKVILAKWLIANTQVLLLDEPTRGIDVNAKSEFYGLMNEFVDQGGCIVMVSSELPEILGVSDRVIVMREGHITGELTREEASEQSVIELASFHS